MGMIGRDKIRSKGLDDRITLVEGDTQRLPVPSGAFGVVCVAHYVLGGLGMFALGRQYTRFRSAALFGAVTFQFSAMMVSHIALTPHLYTVAWIPWMLWAIDAPGHSARRPVFQMAVADRA